MEEKIEKTQVEDIERGIYDIIEKEDHKFTTNQGLNEEVVREISNEKQEPQWMLEHRLKSLEVYNSKPIPTWGADLSELDVQGIIHYVKPNANLEENWEDVPDYIKNTFDRLGIPEAEKKSLAGVGAQYDSEVVYHKVNEELTKLGVIYTDIETALKDHEDIVKKYFMKLITMHDHKFSALHGAVWSGGSFVYVPKGDRKSVV